MKNELCDICNTRTGYQRGRLKHCDQPDCARIASLIDKEAAKAVTRELRRLGLCAYSLYGVRCGQRSTAGDACATHSREKCFKCGSPATGMCTVEGGLGVCGAARCDLHSHNETHY